VQAERAFAGTRLQAAERPKLGGRRVKCAGWQSPKPRAAGARNTAGQAARYWLTWADYRMAGPERSVGGSGRSG